MGKLHEFLAAERVEHGAWRFHVPSTLHGAFGGAFGGVLAACTLIVARDVSPGRVPNAIDCRFVRGLREPDASATATVIHEGRRLSNVSVDVVDATGTVCTRSTISLVDPATLHGFVTDGPAPGDWKAYDDVEPWPPVAPIVTAIDSRIVGSDQRGIATAIRIPWDDGHSAEAACMAADMAVGPPLGSGAPQGVATPNPDLSLRFCGEVTTPIVVGVGRLDRAWGGVAATTLEVWSDATLVATGVSTALLIP